MIILNYKKTNNMSFRVDNFSSGNNMKGTITFSYTDSDLKINEKFVYAQHVWVVRTFNNWVVTGELVTF